MGEEIQRSYGKWERGEMLREVQEFSWLTWQNASDKGYPKVMDRARYFVITDEERHLIGYTTSTEIVDCVFLVGNTYVEKQYNGQGFHEKLLRWRNEYLTKYGGHVIYAPLNPQGKTTIAQLRHVVDKLGYEKATYKDMRNDGLSISQILSLKLTRLEIWRKLL
jgi:predicted GNAT family acetyltransferase